MRRAGSFSHLNQRAQACIVSVAAFNPHHLSVIDLRNDLVLRHTGCDFGNGPVHHRTDSLASLAHINQFCLRLHEALPVHQLLSIRQRRVRQALHQMGMGAGGVVMGIQLDTDPLTPPTPLLNECREVVIRMLGGMMDQRFRESGDILRRNIGRDVRRFGILGPAEPDRRVLFEMQQHRLWRVERPAIKPCQPIHVCRILTDNEVKPLIRHALFGLRNPAVVFRFLKRFGVLHNYGLG